MQDYYKILEVDANASPEEIKKSFRNLSKKYHPDNFINADEVTKKAAEAKFKQILEAYTKIKNGQASTENNFTTTAYKTKKDFSDIYKEMFNEFFYNEKQENEQAFDDFQRIYSKLKKELNEIGLHFGKGIERFINLKNRGVISKEEFENVRNQIEYRINFQKLKKYYLDKKQEALSLGITLTAGDMLLSNEKDKKYNLSKIKSQIDREFKEIILKIEHLEEIKSFKIYLKAVELIFKRYEISSEDLKNINLDSLSYSSMLSIQRKLNKTILNLVIKGKEKYIEAINNANKKYKVLKINLNDLSESELNLIVKTILEFESTSNIYSRFKTKLGLNKAIWEQLNQYRTKVKEILEEIKILCENNAIQLNLNTLTFYDLDYFLSYEELQILKEIITLEYSETEEPKKK